MDSNRGRNGARKAVAADGEDCAAHRCGPPMRRALLARRRIREPQGGGDRQEKTIEKTISKMEVWRTGQAMTTDDMVMTLTTSLDMPMMQATWCMTAVTNLCPRKMSLGMEARWIRRSCTTVGTRAERRWIVEEYARRRMVPSVEFGHVLKRTCSKRNSEMPAARGMNMAEFMKMYAGQAEGPWTLAAWRGKDEQGMSGKTSRPEALTQASSLPAWGQGTPNLARSQRPPPSLQRRSQ